MSGYALTITKLLLDPTTSTWLKDALSTALSRDPVDATHDAERLAWILRNRLDTIQKEDR